MRVYEGAKVGASFEIETTELSKATLDPALFDIPGSPFAEVDSMSELNSKRVGPIDTSTKTVFKGEKGGKAVKTIAIDYFSGNATKIDQEELRNYIAGKINAIGLSGFVVSSQADIAGGRFPNILGVEVKKAKESGAAKIGGLFGKVTGSEDAAKVGKSTAEIVVTLYGADGKTIVASSPASSETKGSVTDAVKAAIDQVIDGIIAKMK